MLKDAQQTPDSPICAMRRIPGQTQR